MPASSTPFSAAPRDGGPRDTRPRRRIRARSADRARRLDPRRARRARRRARPQRRRQVDAAQGDRRTRAGGQRRGAARRAPHRRTAGASHDRRGPRLRAADRQRLPDDDRGGAASFGRGITPAFGSPGGARRILHAVSRSRALPRVAQRLLIGRPAADGGDRQRAAASAQGAAARRALRRPLAQDGRGGAGKAAGGPRP